MIETCDLGFEHFRYDKLLGVDTTGGSNVNHSSMVKRVKKSVLKAKKANAMFAVQHSTPEAFDDWRETSASSKDFQEWVQTAFTMAKFTGSNLIAALDLYPVNSTALLQ